MSLRVELSPFLKGFLLPVFAISCFWLVIFLVLSPYLYKERRNNENSCFTCESEKKNSEAVSRENTYEELSPNRDRKVIRYKLDYRPELFSKSYTTYLDNNAILAVVKNIGDVERESFLFIGEERTGNPHWLGNRYLFFKAHCGSSCQGLILLDTENRQIWNGVLSYYAGKDESQKTHFSSWFDQDFELDGSIGQIHADIVDNKPYLIFDMKNEQGVEIGQRRFLFTGSKLILEP